MKFSFDITKPVHGRPKDEGKIEPPPTDIRQQKEKEAVRKELRKGSFEKPDKKKGWLG